jgi:hypothetical protein
MRNKKIWLGMLVLALVFGMLFISCDSGDNTDPKDQTGPTGPTDTTYTVTADGTADTVTTTQLSFTFSAAVSGLTAGDITITAGTGSASKGTLTGSDTSWSLGVTDVAAGTVKVKIDKTGIENGEKTVTVNTVNEVLDTANGSSQAQAITLKFTQWKDGSVATGEAKWYKFEATSGTSYRLQWKDEDVSDDYTAWIKVTAYQSNGTTNITTVNGATSGWTNPRTISGVSGTVYIKVEPYSSLSSYAGTYAIRFYNPAIIVPQVPMSISSASATPGPTVVVTWASVYSTSGVSGYRVYKSNSETGTYTQIGADITSYSTIRYTDTNVTAGSTYWYKVAAYNSVGEGDKSDAKQSDAVPNTSVGTELTIGAAITESTINMETVWYKFTAVSGTTYNVQWADSYQKPSESAYTGDIYVSAFKSDGTPISGFQRVDSGWTAPKTVSGVSGIVYIKVEVYINSISGTASTGTYGIKVYQ